MVVVMCVCDYVYGSVGGCGGGCGGGNGDGGCGGAVDINGDGDGGDGSNTIGDYVYYADSRQW